MENPLKTLKIKNYYSYLLSLAGSILLISLFIETTLIPRTKLIILSLITICYGLIEWIRKSHFNEQMNNLIIKWENYWEDKQQEKGIIELMDKTYESKIRKEFEDKYKINNLFPNYHNKTWIILIAYLILMVIFFIKSN